MDGSKDSPSIRISMVRLIPGSQGCATIPFIQTLTQRICTHELPTFSANLLFRCDAGNVEHSRIQSVLVVLDLVTMGLVTATRRAIGQPAERVIVYAWHPLPIFEFGGSGHIDAHMICFIDLALFARAHQKFGIAGFCAWSRNVSQIFSCHSATGYL